jgi:hypothetical protein
MDLAVESDIYEPHLSDKELYIDFIPSSSKFINGLRCPCGTRKDHIFDTRQSFTNHIKTQTHKKWLNDLNLNKTNFFTECEKLKELVNSQKIIIAQKDKEILLLNKEIQLKSKTIDILTEQLSKNQTTSIDLISFD